MFGVFLKTWLSKVWGNSAIPISNQKFFLCKPQPDPGGLSLRDRREGPSCQAPVGMGNNYHRGTASLLHLAPVHSRKLSWGSAKDNGEHNWCMFPLLCGQAILQTKPYIKLPGLVAISQQRCPSAALPRYTLCCVYSFTPHRYGTHQVGGEQDQL